MVFGRYSYRGGKNVMCNSVIKSETEIRKWLREQHRHANLVSLRARTTRKDLPEKYIHTRAMASLFPSIKKPKIRYEILFFDKEKNYWDGYDAGIKIDEVIGAVRYARTKLGLAVPLRLVQVFEYWEKGEMINRDEQKSLDLGPQTKESLIPW